MRRGFTLIEVLLVLGVLSVLGGLSVVSYRRFQIRSDLNLATEQISQAVARAKLLAQSGQNDGPWGFNAPAGVVFQGQSYLSRDLSADLPYAMPSTIQASGLVEVVFSKGEGKPSATGTIVLTNIVGEQGQVSIMINEQGIATNIDDVLTVCHQPGNLACATKQLNESAWNGHKNHGDHLGPCLPAECE